MVPRIFRPGVAVKEVLSAQKHTALQLQAKEGVALINGTQPMTSVGALSVYDAMGILRDASIAAAMSLEALRGTRAAFDERIQDLRPHEGQKAEQVLSPEATGWAHKLLFVSRSIPIRCRICGGKPGFPRVALDPAEVIRA